MKLNYYDNPEELKKPIKLSYQPIVKGGRTFTVAEDIEVVLSDGFSIVIKEGTITDLSSVPKCLWSIFTPIDEGFIADLIHDYLWIDKVGQITHFDNSPYQARKFADDERNRWRVKLAPRMRLKNFVTHWFLRVFGSPFYNRKFKIPS